MDNRGNRAIFAHEKVREVPGDDRRVPRRPVCSARILGLPSRLIWERILGDQYAASV